MKYLKMNYLKTLTLLTGLLLLLNQICSLEVSAFERKNSNGSSRYRVGSLNLEDFNDLTGSLRGWLKNSEEKVELILTQKPSKPGTYTALMLIGDPEGIVFSVEIIPNASRLGFAVVGLTSERAEIETKSPPLAVLQVVIDSQGEVDHLEIIPQVRNSVLNEVVVLDYLDPDVSLVTPSLGTYRSGDWWSSENKKNVVVLGADALIEARVPEIAIYGQFVASLDQHFMMSMRAVSFDANYQAIESEKISAIFWGVNRNGSESILMGMPSKNGQRTYYVELDKQ